MKIRSQSKNSNGEEVILIALKPKELIELRNAIAGILSHYTKDDLGSMQVKSYYSNFVSEVDKFMNERKKDV